MAFIPLELSLWGTLNNRREQKCTKCEDVILYQCKLDIYFTFMYGGRALENGKSEKATFSLEMFV